MASLSIRFLSNANGLPWEKLWISQVFSAICKSVIRQSWLSMSFRFQDFFSLSLHPSAMEPFPPFHLGSESWSSSDQADLSMQPHERPWTRTTQISCSWIPDLQKTMIINDSCFKSLNFGVICYTVSSDRNSDFKWTLNWFLFLEPRGVPPPIPFLSK